MRSNDGPFRIGPTGTSAESDQGGGPDSIREAQRRRRQAARVRADVEAILAAPDEDEEEDEPRSAIPAAPPARVYVVFRGAKWEDPDGQLRESDSIVGVFDNEGAAHRTVFRLNQDARSKGDRMDAWYQPYPVESVEPA